MEKNSFIQRMKQIVDFYLPERTENNNDNYNKSNLYNLNSFSNTRPHSLRNKNIKAIFNQNSENRLNKKIKVYTELFKTNKYPINQDKIVLKKYPYQSDRKFSDFMKRNKFDGKDTESKIKPVNLNQPEQIIKKNVKNTLIIFDKFKTKKRYYVSNLNWINSKFSKTIC